MKNENLIPLRDAPEHLPKRNGKSINPATIYRWSQSGVAGFRLETMKIGGCLFTSVEAIERFIERTNDVKKSVKP
jgi:hypothetical protein